jgi:hypothetical protein
MKTIYTVFACLFFASAAELCARKPDLCKRVDADQKRSANTPQDPAPKQNESISSKSTSE